jgi:hypothetical protein
MSTGQNCTADNYIVKQAALSKLVFRAQTSQHMATDEAWVKNLQQDHFS